MPGGYLLGLRLLRSQGRVANFFIRQPRRSATGQGLGCTERTFEEHICSCSGGEGLSTATAPAPAPAPARLTAHQSGILVHREGQDGPNPAACLEISIHLTTRPPSPSDAWMHPSKVCIPDIEICRRRASRVKTAFLPRHTALALQMKC